MGFNMKFEKKRPLPAEKHCATLWGKTDEKKIPPAAGYPAPCGRRTDMFSRAPPAKGRERIFMFQDKPVIAVMPLYDDERESYWMLPGYMKALEEQGAVVLMPALTDRKDELDYFLESCDGFVLTGGHDVSPELYREERSPLCGATSLLRDRMDAYILKGAADRDKAVLGICRGIQLMNAAFGGTIYQDLPAEHPSDVEHHATPPYDKCAHTVRIEPDSPLFSLLQEEICPVNSYHHQAIRRLSPDFAVMAEAPDGIAEAICMPARKFIWGVQWHPEFSYQSSWESRKILGAFLAAAKSGKR